MKKLGLLLMPLMAISFLASCNNNDGLGKPKPLEECTWEEISKVSKAHKASKWFRVGDIKTVKVNNQDHKVRIIGFNQDVDKNGRKIGITFEFANLISDENGYSLATYWNNTANNDPNYSYIDSTIYKALNGDTNDINWFRYYGEGEDTEGIGKNRHFASEGNYKKSILNMLPDDLTKKGILKTTSKYININDGDGWKEETVDDKLFLLSPFEMGEERSNYEEAHTTTYSYYEGAEDSRRIKKQIKGSEGARTKSVSGTDLDGEYTGGKKSSYAGYNNKNAQNGAESWLRSPYTEAAGLSWCVDRTGVVRSYSVCNVAYGIAPAFCI